MRRGRGIIVGVTRAAAPADIEADRGEPVESTVDVQFSQHRAPHCQRDVACSGSVGTYTVPI